MAVNENGELEHEVQHEMLMLVVRFCISLEYM